MTSELDNDRPLDDATQAVCATADATPTDVDLQIKAAWACDSYGAETRAVSYYDNAWKLGVPADIRARFLVGYGSTLRNVGRTDESIERLTNAIADYPEMPALRAFLGLSLLAAGRHNEAMANALDALIAAGSDNLEGYDRSLRGYAAHLRERV